MSIYTCVVTTNSNNEETGLHGTAQFPIAIYEETLTDGIIPWHWHNDLELIWVNSGSIKVLVDSNEFTISQGHGIFINVEKLHFICSIKEGKACFKSIVFHPRLIDGLESIIWQKYIGPVTQNKSIPYIILDPVSPWQEQIIKLSDSVWSMLHYKERGYEIYARNYLSEILFIILKNHSSCENILVKQNIRNSQRVKQMMKYIHCHYYEEISLSDLSREAMISESEVLRCFHNTIHITPLKYVKQYRVQMAAKLLVNTSKSSLEIALDCGFQSSSYFTKTFRQLMGCTPIAYRRSIEKDLH